MKKLGFGISLLASALLFVGCSSGATDSKKEVKKTSDGKEVVTMWGSWSGDQIKELDQQLEIYNKSQKKYEVKYVMQENVEEKLLTGLAGGELPDLIMWDRYQTALYASKGALKPTDELIKKDNVNLDDFYEEAVKEMTVNGKIYGLPLLVDTRVMFYNKELLENNQVPKTWDELKEIAPKVTKYDGKKITQAGFSLEDLGLFNMYAIQAGVKLIEDNNKSIKFNNAEGQSVLNLWDELENTLNVYSRGFDDDGSKFAAGKMAMMYDGPWALSNLNKVDGLNYGVSLPLEGPNGDKGSIMGGFGLVIPQKANNENGAWDFMKWWTTKPENGIEFAKISGWLPANKVATQNDYFTKDPYYSVFVEALENAKTRPTVKGYSTIEDLALRPQLENFMNGNVSAEKALSTVDKEGNRILEEEN